VIPRLPLKFDVRRSSPAWSHRASSGSRAWLAPDDVARVLKRSEYKRAGDWRIVDPRVWNEVQAALAGRRKRT
jgi:hypothetical protein